MQLLRSPLELPTHARRVCLAIGTFDGVHLGHQQVIRQALMNARQHAARAVVVTFDAHPATIVAPHRVPPLISSSFFVLQTTLGEARRSLVDAPQAA